MQLCPDVLEGDAPVEQRSGGGLQGGVRRRIGSEGVGTGGEDMTRIEQPIDGVASESWRGRGDVRRTLATAKVEQLGVSGQE